MEMITLVWSTDELTDVELATIEDAH